MKLKMIGWVIAQIFDRVDEAMVEAWIAQGLDMLEARVIESKTPIDDMAVLPLIKLAREIFDIDEEA